MKFAIRATLLMMALLFDGAAPALAQDMCAPLNKLYPQPGRTGGLGDNSFRPLPEFLPLRDKAGGPGTLSLSIDVDHVSSELGKGRPGFLYVGNYPVTDIPAFRLAGGASGPAELIDPVTGYTVSLPNQCIAGPDWGYSGSTWALLQGDTLDVMFQSRLDYVGKNAVPEPVNGAMPCRSGNLHTHGLAKGRRAITCLTPRSHVIRSTSKPTSMTATPNLATCRTATTA
jgi:hypothetical protein